jgi:hypothetical protein
MAASGVLVVVLEGGSATSAAPQLINRGTKLRQAIAALLCFDQKWIKTFGIFV